MSISAVQQSQTAICVCMCVYIYPPYDKPRQYIEKQRHYSANRSPYSQGCGLPSGHVQLWELDYKRRQNVKKLMPSNYGAGEDAWKSLGHQGDQTTQYLGNTSWKDWCRSWSSSILVIWCKQPTHWKSPWCWERMRVEREEGVREWDDWMELPMQWTWTWANFGRW